MRTEIAAAIGVRVGRIQDKTRWTKAVGEAATFVYGDCNEEIDLSQHSSKQRVLLMTAYSGRTQSQ